MNLLIHSNCKDNFSVSLTLAQELARHLGGETKTIRLYDEPHQYYKFNSREDWIDDIIAAECIIMPVAMWNYTIPASLKDFFDKTVKRGRLFELDADNRRYGLLKDKPLYVIMTSGEEYPENSPEEFVVPVIKQIVSTIGIFDVRTFRVGNVSGSKALCQDAGYIDGKTKEMLQTFRL